MHVKLHSNKQKRCFRKLSKYDIFEAILLYLKEGKILDPEVVCLPTFNPQNFTADELDMSGVLDDHQLYAWEVYFHRKSRLVCAEFKTYFFKEIYRTNGITCCTPVRLTSFLRYAIKNLSHENRAYKFKILLNDECEGCILFANGTLIHFNSTNGKKSLRNFYITAIESGVDDSNLHKAEVNAKYAHTRYEKELDINDNKKLTPSVVRLISLLVSIDVAKYLIK